MLIRLTLGMASLLSLSFSLLFWASLAEGSLKIMFIILAFILESTKWLAWRQARRAYVSKNLLALFGAGALFALLFVLSISFTSLQLHSSYLAQQEKGIKHSSQYQIIEQQIKQQQDYIAVLLENAKHDTVLGFRSRAQKVLGQDLSQAQDTLKVLLQAQAQHKDVNVTSLKALSGVFFGWPAHNIELLLCFILGSLLDIILAFLFWVQSLCFKPCSEHTTVLQPPIDTEEQAPPASKGKNPAGTKEYDEVKRLIVTKRCNPGIRFIKEVAKVGSQKAKSYLSAMEKEGIVIRENLTYRLNPAYC